MDSSADAQQGSGSQKRQDSIDEYNVYDDAKTYYTDSRHKANKATARTRTFSQVRNSFVLICKSCLDGMCLRGVDYRIVSCSRWRDWA